MTLPLLRPSQLARQQRWAKAMFATSISIDRPAFAGDAMGDDDQDAADAHIATLTGWLHTEPVQATTLDGSSIVTVVHYRLNVPIGTDIKPRDIVTVNASGQRYAVIDTNADETWPEMLDCSLRIRK